MPVILRTITDARSRVLNLAPPVATTLALTVFVFFTVVGGSPARGPNSLSIAVPAHAQELVHVVHFPVALANASPRPAPSPIIPPLPTTGPPIVAAADTPGLYGVTSSYVMLRSAQGAEPPIRRFHFGSSQTAFNRVQPVSGDFDGDGFDSIGFYDPRKAAFTLQNKNAANVDETVIPFGEPTIPTDDGGYVYAVSGDFDGDGKDTFGLFTVPDNTFRLRNSNSPGPPDMEFSYGLGAVFPLIGDWDGDGVDTVGVWVQSTGRAFLRNSNDAGPEHIVAETGRPGLIPFTGDFDGDGVDTLGVYDGDSFMIHSRDSHDASGDERSIHMGSRAAVWWPLAGLWESSGETGETGGFDWAVTDPAEVGIDPDRLGVAYARAAEIENLHSLLVIRHGKLAGEAYYGGYDASMGNCLKSVSKSILSALYGLAIEDGHVRGLEQPASAHLPEYFAAATDPRLGGISVYNLLTMTGGLEWTDPTHIGPMNVSGDWLRFITTRPFTSEPGARWNYSTGLTHAASAFLTEATGEATHEYASERLFEPLGISATRWDHDTAGYDFGGAEVWMRPRDMARFGELYLRGGELDGERILDERWVNASKREHASASGGHTYGYWWWRREFAGHPTYFAWGYGGQFIFVVEDLDMVVVATSAWFRGASAATNGEVFALLANHVLPAATED